MTRLGKHDVEALLFELDSATSGPFEEVAVLVARLTPALRKVLDLTEPLGWGPLVDRASLAGGWPEQRRTAVRSADDPSRDGDPESVLWALWDLVTELNEHRDLIRSPSVDRAAGDGP